jgi:AraC-like DNA-binding protein
MQQSETNNWRNNLSEGAQLWRLFEDMPDVLFFIKDTHSFIRQCNQALIDHLGLENKEQLIGKHDMDFLPHYMVEKYKADDAVVIETEEPLLHIIELFPAKNGLPQLFMTNKYPVFDPQNRIVGICGFIRKVNDDTHAHTDYSNLAPAIDFISEHFRDKISVEQLAACSKLSVRQFQRRFKRVFHTTPKEYIIKYRLLRAAEQLVNSSGSITDIALNNGFYDHSAFVKHFKKTMSLTPLKYRSKFTPC